MGFDLYVNVIVGFKLEVKKVLKTDTRFNEYTGEPYDIQLPSHVDAYIGDTKIFEKLNDDDEYSDIEDIIHDYVYPGVSLKGLEVFTSGDQGDGTMYLGEPLFSYSQQNDFNQEQYTYCMSKDSMFSQAIQDMYNLTGVYPGKYLVIRTSY